MSWSVRVYYWRLNCSDYPVHSKYQQGRRHGLRAVVANLRATANSLHPEFYKIQTGSRASNRGRGRLSTTGVNTSSSTQAGTPSAPAADDTRVFLGDGYVDGRASRRQRHRDRALGRLRQEAFERLTPVHQERDQKFPHPLYREDRLETTTRRAGVVESYDQKVPKLLDTAAAYSDTQAERYSHKAKPRP